MGGLLSVATKSMRANGRSGIGKRSRGQAVVEFALVAPVLLFMLFGVLDGGLMVFVVGTARYGAEEVARQESQSANSVTADADAIAALRKTAIASTTLGKVIGVDIYKMTQASNGTLSVDNSHYNHYNLAGACISTCTWTSSTRNVIDQQSDFLGVKLTIQYNWMSGKLLGQPPLTFTTTYTIRLEPQTY